MTSRVAFIIGASSGIGYATLGEITDVMRETFGVYREPLQI